MIRYDSSTLKFPAKFLPETSNLATRLHNVTFQNTMKKNESSTPKTEATSSSKTSLNFYQNSRHHITGDMYSSQSRSLEIQTSCFAALSDQGSGNNGPDNNFVFVSRKNRTANWHLPVTRRLIRVAHKNEIRYNYRTCRPVYRTSLFICAQHSAVQRVHQRFRWKPDWSKYRLLALACDHNPSPTLRPPHQCDWQVVRIQTQYAPLVSRHPYNSNPHPHCGLPGS
jgi:hypothetical protein